MKINLRQKAKSALSILLTLCMILSVLTVGIVSTSAAETDQAEVGASDLGTVWFDNAVTKWTDVYCFVGKTGYVRAYKMDAIAGNSTIFSKNIGGFTDRTALFFASSASSTFTAGTSKYSITSTKTTLTSGSYTNNIAAGSDDGSLFYVKSATNNSQLYRQTTKYVLASGNSEGSSGLASASWSTTADVMNYNGSSYSITYKDVNAGSYAVSVVKYNDWNTTYKYDAVGTGTNCTLGDNGGNDHNLKITTTAKADITITLTSQNKINVTATVKKLAAPTNVKINNVTDAKVNASTANSTLTWNAVSGAESYEIYKGSSKVGTSTTTSYSIQNVTANAGSYTVKAVPTDSGYLTSDASSPAVTLTVYEPKYCIVGNVDDGIIQNGSVVTPSTTGLSGAGWWITWQENLQVSTPTATPGVYSFTFTANENSGHSGALDFGIYLKGTGQKAFEYNGVKYNTASTDLVVPDSGLEGIKVIDTATTNAGGALQMKRGQTYTITINQTASPHTIKITAADKFVDVAAKSQKYNATSRQYDAIGDAVASIGTVSASPVHGTNGEDFTSTLTATVVNTDYAFEGWYTDAACTGTKASADATFTPTISQTTTYYALFKQIKPNDYSVTVNQPAEGTITLPGGTASTTSPTSAYQGATVSMKYNKASNPTKEFVGWKITSDNTNQDVTSALLNANSTAANGSFTMPGYPVTVTAELRDRTKVTINISSNNNTLGTATYTDGTYYVGDEISISATATDGTFMNWTVVGGTLANANSASTKVTATGSTVTLKAIFDYKAYQLYYNRNNYPLIRQSDGSYASTFKIPQNSQTFTVYNASDKKYAVSGTGETWLFNDSTRSATIYNDTTVNNSAWTNNVGKQYKNNGTAAYMVFYPPGHKIGATTYGNGQISLVTTNPLGTVAEIYAKDGSIRYRDGGTSSGGGQSSGLLWDDPDWSAVDSATDHRGKMTCLKGTTVITAINDTSVTDPESKRYAGDYKNGSSTVSTSEHLKIYSAPIGSTITIQTTVNDTYKNQGFYVGMFVVNGWKVPATDMGNGKYVANYTLTSENSVKNLSKNDSFEITPVYYNSNFEYITFYVDAKSVPSSWGNTISTCTDYNGAYYPHFEGSYPGQPLGREGDLYEIKVAKYYYSLSGNKWTKQVNFHPSATITAYNYDSVHHYYYVYADENVNTSNNKNLQTYDYSDFAYLAQIKDVEAIMFRCKETTNDNKTNQGHWNLDYTGQKYELLTDYYGNPIDALGNVLKDSKGNVLDPKSLKESDAKIKIVSAGNNNTSSSSINRTKAQWSTIWLAYNLEDSNKKAIAMRSTPADFINTNINTPGAAASRNISFTMADGTSSGANAATLEGKVTFISYDMERTNTITGIDDTGQRIDGQWYYSAKHDFTSDVKVAITTTENGSDVKTTNTTIENNTTASENKGYTGATSGTKATLDGETKHVYSNVTTEAELNSNVGSGYIFVGWYIYDASAGTYTKIHDNYSDQNTTMTMKKNYTIVAVVRKADENSLTITHTRYTGSHPDPHDGTGKYYVSAEIIHANGSTTKVDEKQNAVTIAKLAETDQLKITLRTVCNGANKFFAWYEEVLDGDYNRTGNYYEICDEKSDPMGEKEVSYTFFAADGKYLQDRKTLDFYSDISHVSKYANLTYKYIDRFATNGKNQLVSYTVKNVPLTDDEIEAGYIPTDEKIAKYAPTVVDTIYTDTKWTIEGTKIERAESNITLVATQKAKTCFVEYVPGDQVGSDLLKGKSEELPVQDVVTWNTRYADYNSWLINSTADPNNPQESDFYVNAPESYVDGYDTWNFVRFDVYEFDRVTGAIGKVLYSSNDHTFGYRIYTDCIIYPVYTKNVITKELTAKIEPAVLNREVYGDSASPVDKLYADLLVSYINIAAATDNDIPEVIKENAADSGYEIETGFVLDKRISLSDTDYNALKSAAEHGTTDNTDTIVANYASQFSKADATAVAKGTSKDGYKKNVLINNLLTNKNRTDAVVRFTNTEVAQKKVYAAYSYIIIKKNGVEHAFAISDAQLFNFCYLGNEPLEKVKISE